MPNQISSGAFHRLPLHETASALGSLRKKIPEKFTDQSGGKATSGDFRAFRKLVQFDK